MEIYLGCSECIRSFGSMTESRKMLTYINPQETVLLVIKQLSKKVFRIELKQAQEQESH